MTKPIFIIRYRQSLQQSEVNKLRDDIFTSEIYKEYHVMYIRNDEDREEFEMYNADKIDKQEWNGIVNKILK